MSSLVVVSNRVPDYVSRKPQGGLAVAMASVLEGTDGLWFGWSGAVIDAPVPGCRITRPNGFRLATLDLTKAEYRGYYEDFSNRVLWPLFHGRPDLVRSGRNAYEVYSRTNDRFASALMPLLDGSETIWVHDYHLIPLARALRRLGVKSRIGFFLHIPFPPSDAFLALPQNRDLIEAFYAYNLIGFQTTEDEANFRETVQRVLLTPAEAVNGHSAPPRTGVFGIGIDVDAFSAFAETNKGAFWRHYCPDLGKEVIRICGVDRLDYSKGLAAKMQGFELFLKNHPSLHDKVTLVQVASPTRENIAAYKRTRAEVRATVERINTRFGSDKWTPVRLINRSVRRDLVADLMRGSRACLVTPLRDGMNLVAKEYVAAQDPDDPGVLILSRFAGAAEGLGGNALLIDPHRPASIAAALDNTVRASLKTRRRHWRAMMQELRSHDVNWWKGAFLDSLRRGPPGLPSMPSRQPGRKRRVLHRFWRRTSPGSASRRRAARIQQTGAARRNH